MRQAIDLCNHQGCDESRALSPGAREILASPPISFVQIAVAVTVLSGYARAARENNVKRFEDILAWAQAHPRWAAGAIVIAIALYLLARRKPRLMRDAERDLEHLRETRAGQYDDLRPLR